jgi:maleate isomerase
MTDNRDDIYGRRARIGYTSPPLTTEVFPYEFYQMVPAGVTLVLTTLAIVARSKDEVDRSYDISMQAAREMAAAGVDIVVLGGVPINLSRGYANAQQIIGDLEAELKVKVSTSASAQAGAAKALGCKKAIVTWGASSSGSIPRPTRCCWRPPHWPTAGAIEQLERELGINVMTAQQAIVWDALRRCGVSDPIPGFGRLLREF